MRKKLQHALGGYLLESHALIQRALHRTQDNSGNFFILFGRGRSGSTLLVRMLNGHPEITCLGEILRYRTFAPRHYIENRMAVAETHWRGFKLLSYQLRDLCSQSRQRAIRNWLEVQNVKIIHLKRDNLLRHAVSNLYAAQRNIYHSTDKNTKSVNQKIRIEPAELIRWIDGSQALLEFESAFLDGLPHHSVSYEQNLSTVSQQDATYLTITRGFDLPDYPVQSDLEKVTPTDLRQLIVNYMEIEQALNGTPYEIYLTR